MRGYQILITVMCAMLLPCFTGHGAHVFLERTENSIPNATQADKTSFLNDPQDTLYVTEKAKTPSDIMRIIKNRKRFPNYVLVSAHRGYWADYPENTLDAFLMAIEAGADIVEMDVRLTKDNVMVVFHDACLDRLTNAYGRLNQFDYEHVKNLFLRNHEGELTRYHILRLDDAIEALKGKAVIALDIKEGGKDYDITFVRVLRMLKEKNMLQYSIVKGKKRLTALMPLLIDAGVTLSDFEYTPIAFANTKNLQDYVNEYVNLGLIHTFELVYKQSEDVTLNYAQQLKNAGIWLGQYSFWPEQPEGVVAEKNPLDDSDPVIRKYDFHDLDPNDPLDDGRGNWPWLLYKGADYIITDRSELLIDFLQLIGRRETK